MDPYQQLNQYLAESRAIVFFGGAGVSTESGIPDFRSARGLYRQSRYESPETILSHDFFYAHPDIFYSFYREHLVHRQARPHTAHSKLAELERKGRLLAVITQNIDGLHQQAGSRRVLELHGSIHRNTCLTCRSHHDLSYILDTEGVPYCPCGGLVKPDVVLYGEPLDPDVFSQAIAAIEQADLLIIGGTSLAVYPAAGLVDFFSGRLILINQSTTAYDGQADLIFRESIGRVMSCVRI